jgi:hypothetical protein
MEVVEVFWVVTPCSDAVGYLRFGGLATFITLKTVAARSSETYVSSMTRWRHNPEYLDLNLLHRKTSNM